ncbi:MAG: (d)CMP kinase [Eubacteriales bacterium]|nr:(d)CMP kinase [Eubacteriales bacterium]
MPFLNIAIDGPAGAGKSTIAKAVAKELGILYLDTGAMYRAMALCALRAGVDPNDAARVLPLLEVTDIFAKCIDGVQHTFLNGEDVSGLIRTPEVSKGASDIAVIPAVRVKLAQTQRNIAMESDVVMDGREIGSYVIPQTPYKFFVTASVEERARRRLAELREKGQYNDVSQEEMQSEIAARDHTDSTRAFAPLKRMPDAVLIDTTDMDIPTAVRAVLSRIKR